MSDLALLAGTPVGHAMRRFWRLEPDIHFLNHGSFGAAPNHVLAVQQDWRDRFERQPIRFVGAELPSALRAAAERLAAFLGTSGERLAFVENATGGVNAVLRSLRWQPGDEIVIANHAYPGVRNTVGFVAERYGLTVREASIPFPLARQADITDAYAAALTQRTRLVLVDHVFSALAIVSPVAEIVALCKQRKVPVLIDGAHAPGMLPLELDRLGADYYTGNCHKWLFAPKGCAFLHASPAASADLHPAVISNFYKRGFPLEFDWQGTRDPSAWLAVTAALDFVEALGVERYRNTLRAQIADAAQRLFTRWHVELPAPLDTFGAMLTLPLPSATLALETGAALEVQAAQWHDKLWHEHRIEIPVLVINDRLWVRVSAQMYNDASDIDALADALSPR